MKTYQLTLRLDSAFGTPLMGDTLFGQCCWAIVHHFGEARLTELLEGYTAQRPFMVVSDAFPNGYFPLPTLPSAIWQTGDETDRKKLKKRQWVGLAHLSQAVENWQKLAKASGALLESQQHNRLHNTINRATGTTGNDQFAPYSTTETWYQTNTAFNLYIIFDENRITATEIETLFAYIGQFGYGRDASTGLGKFSVVEWKAYDFAHQTEPNAYLTLANCAPQQLDLSRQQSFYQITTRFGRHGDIAALGSNPFKKPIILAKAGAIFCPNHWQDRLFLGNGLTDISYAQPNAVHQGYAPVIAIKVPFSRLGGNHE